MNEKSTKNMQKDSPISAPAESAQVQMHEHADPKDPLWKRWASKVGIKNSKRLFWVWIGYQAVKGILTTSLIWIPLLYALWKS